MKTKDTKENRVKGFFKRIWDKRRMTADASQNGGRDKRRSSRAFDILLDIIKKEPGKYNWSDVAGTLATVIALAAYCAISPSLAKYRGTQMLFYAAWAAIIIMVLILAWELVCIAVDTDRKKGMELLGILFTYLKSHLLTVILVLFGGFLLFCMFNPPVKTGYYTGVTEIYGVPAGVGELSQEQLENRAAYWKIVDHRWGWTKSIELTYVEPYGQLEVMKENSSAYSMTLFPAVARVVCKYDTDQKEFREKLDESTFISAAQKGILRTPKSLSYYSSSEKLLLQLEANGFGRAKITAYSADDMPQLLNSTLLRIPDGQSAGNGITSRQIETVYGPDGLPESRRIYPYVYNQYGVNGERYTYTDSGQISTLCYLDVNGEPVCNKLGVMSVSFSYKDDTDALSSIRYFSDENNTEKTEGFYGVFCERFHYDDYGNLDERKELDRSEYQCNDKDGVYIYSYHYNYNEGNRLESEEFYRGDNMSAGNEDNMSVMNTRFLTSKISYGLSKENGNEILTVFYGAASPTAEDEPTLAEYVPTWEESIPKWTEPESASAVPEPTEAPSMPVQTNPDRGSVVQTMVQLIQNRTLLPVSDGEGEGTDLVEAAETQIIPDEEEPVRKYSAMAFRIVPSNRRVAAIRYCGPTGEAVMNEEGYAEKQFRYDSQSRVILESFHDTEGKLCLNGDGYASVERVYDKSASGRLSAEIYLDINNQPAVLPDLGYALVRYSYYEQNRQEIIRKSYHDTEGNAVWLPSLGYAGVEQTYNESGFLSREAYFDTNYAPAYRSGYRVAVILYEYSDSGNLIRESYRDVSGLPTNRLDKGFAAMRQTFDQGLLVRRSYEGYEDHAFKPVPDRTTGAAAVEYQYENGKIRRKDYLGTDDQPVLRRDTGYASCEYKYEDGRLHDEYFYGTDNRPVLSGDYGYAHRMIEYDKGGQILSTRYYGVKEEPVISSYYHCAGFDYEYDGQGNRSTICCIGLDGKPMIRSDLGYAKVKRVYTNGQIKSEKYLDENDAPILCKDGGYARCENKYNDGGNLLETWYYDAYDSPVPHSGLGYAMAQYSYNDVGQRISERYYRDGGDKLAVHSTYHCAGFDYDYDGQGNRSDICYIGLDGKPMIRSDLGYAKVHRTYVQGLLTSEAYYDAGDNRTPCKDGGYAYYESVYDLCGNWIESRYYDILGKPMRMNRGYAAIRNAYDRFGQMISSFFFDAEEMLVISPYYHCAGFLYTYDEKGNQVKVDYMGLDGKPMLGVGLGYARVEKTYNDMGQLTGERYYDTDGLLTVNQDQGYAAYESDYKNGLWMGTRYYDAQGELTPCKKGYAVVVNEYNEDGQRTSQRFYGPNGKTPVVSAEHHCAGYRFDYDGRGNGTYIGYIGPDGELMARSDCGYAQVEKSYNEWNELEYETYLDVNGQPEVWKGRGYSTYMPTYDKGRLKEERYLDADGETVNRSDWGCAVVRYTYDEFGQNTSIRYYCADGTTPCFNIYYHCAGFDYGYDALGNQDSIQYVGLEGEPVIRSDLGYASVKRTYSGGRITSEAYFDADGVPIPCKSGGYARYESDFDICGTWLRSRYYDGSGSLTLRSDLGYAVVEYGFNNVGQRSSERYYGTDGKTLVISSSYHCAGFDYECDMRGNWTKVQYIGLDGKLMIRSDLGYAQADRSFDVMGRLVNETYYDVDGVPTTCKEGGYASFWDTYDANGNWTQSKYYDVQGQLTPRRDTGYAVLRNVYDEFNQRVQEYYYDTDEETLVVSSKYHCAGLIYGYDSKRNMTETRYIDPDGLPMVRSDLGFARVVKRYNNDGQLTGESYYDIYGEPVACKLGYASFESRYENGLWMEERYFDTQGELVPRSDNGYAVAKNTYDQYGRRSTQYYYDTDGETSIVSSRFHCIGFSYAYDERGNQTSSWYIEPDKSITARPDLDLVNYSYYDELYQMTWSAYFIYENDEFVLVMREDLGYAAIENTYEGTHLVEKSYLDENKQLILQDEGYAMLKRKFNDQGQLIRVSYYDEKEELTECKSGYAEVEYQYDKSGNESDRVYCDVSGEKI